MKIKRSKNLGIGITNQILGLLDGWQSQLTWELLIDAVEKKTGQRYTRQALHKREQIKQAFILKKETLADGKGVPRQVSDPTLQLALDRVTRLEAEIKRLTNDNNNLLEQFVRWAYNAGLKGMSIDELNLGIPDVNRRRTRKHPHSGSSI